MVKRPRRPWQDVAKEAKVYRDKSIANIEPSVPNIPGNVPKNIFDTIRSYLSADEVEITELLPQDLLERLAKRQVTAVAVTNAFLRRAALASKMVGVQSLICLGRSS